MFALYVLWLPATGWAQSSQYIAPVDGAGNDWFGSALALSEPYFLATAPGDDDAGRDSGSAYMYRRDQNGDWEWHAKLFAPGAQRNTYFGASGDLDGRFAVIGAPFHDTKGAAFVFEREETTGIWLHVATLMADDGVEHDEFGRAVAISGDTIVVSAPMHTWVPNGRAYIFRRSAGGDWALEAHLDPDPQASESHFGTALAIDGDTIAVRARSGGLPGFNAGCIYIFDRDDTTGEWSETARLTSAAGEGGDILGFDLDLAEDLLLAGAPGDDVLGPSSDSGSASLFVRSGDGTWSESSVLIPSNGENQQQFGYAVGVTADLAVVGMSYGSSFHPSGRGWVFRRHGAAWIETDDLRSAHPWDRDDFGASVAVDATAVLCGAPEDPVDTGFLGAGSVSAFRVAELGCIADWDRSGAVNTADFLSYLAVWATDFGAGCGPTGCHSDLTGDGSADTRDFLAFLGLWAAGC